MIPFLEPDEPFPPVEFALRGLHGASTDVIARRAGISQPYLFRLFGTKKELYLATSQRAIDHLHAVFADASELGSDLLHLRKIVLPARSVLTELSTRKSPFVSEAADEYLRTYVDMAVATGAGWVVVHAGYHFTDDYAMRRQAGLAEEPAGDVHLVDALVAEVAVARLEVPVPVVVERFAADGVFHRGGSGPPLVLLHGFADTWRVWELVLTALERKGFSEPVREAALKQVEGWGYLDDERFARDRPSVEGCEGEVRVERVRYAWTQLTGWYRRLELRGAPGVLAHAPNVIRNRIVVAVVDDSAAARVRTAAERAGVPADAVLIAVTGPAAVRPPRYMLAVQARLGPEPGGVPGVPAVVLRADGGTVHSGSTDSHGNLVVELERGGEYEVRVTAPSGHALAPGEPASRRVRVGPMEVEPQPVTFYFLRDWDKLVERIATALNETPEIERDD